MNTKKHLIIYLLLLSFFFFVSSDLSFATEAEEQLKTQIYDTYGITVYEDDAANGMTWSEDYLKAMIQVF